MTNVNVGIISRYLILRDLELIVLNKLWKTFTDCFNCLPLAAIIDEKIFCCHGGLSPDLESMEQIRRIIRPTGIYFCWLLPRQLYQTFRTKDFYAIFCGPTPKKTLLAGEKTIAASRTLLAQRSSPNSYTSMISIWYAGLLECSCPSLRISRAHQVVEDGYEFFAKRQLVTLFSAPNYCGEFDNAGAMMSVDDSLMCSFQVHFVCLIL